MCDLLLIYLICIYLCIYIYIYKHSCIYIYIYVYIYIHTQKIVKYVLLQGLLMHTWHHVLWDHQRDEPPCLNYTLVIKHCNWTSKIYTHRIHGAGIFTNIETPFLWPSFVGKYTSTMDPMGMIFPALNVISLGYCILYCQTSDYCSPILDALPKK